MQTTLLEDIAEVQTGYPFRTKVEHDPAGDLWVVQGKDIRPDRTLDLKHLTCIRLPDRKRPEKKFIRQGDLLFMTRSDRPFAVLVDEPMPPTVVQNSFNVIRIRSKAEVLPEFLAMALNQTAAEIQISQMLKGTAISYIRVEDLRRLPVPVPSLDRQRSLVALERSMTRERQLHRRLEAARKEQLDAIIQRIATNNHSSKRP